MTVTHQNVQCKSVVINVTLHHNTRKTFDYQSSEYLVVVLSCVFSNMGYSQEEKIRINYSDPLVYHSKCHSYVHSSLNTSHGQNPFPEVTADFLQ